MRKLSLLLAIALLLTLLGPVSRASAATLTVTDFGDTSSANCTGFAPGQLRTLIRNANNGDTIIIPAGTITLTGTTGDDQNCSGDLDISKNLTIQGAGAGQTIIQAGMSSGAGVDRVFDINQAVTLIGVTIRHGRLINAGERGAGLRIRAAGAVTLTDSVVTQNIVSRGFGGGISAFSTSLTLTNTIVSYNTAVDSGGVRAEGAALTIQNGSQILGNVSTGGAAAGVSHRNTATTLTITNSTITGNQSIGAPSPYFVNGSGVSTDGALTMTNSIVSGNTINNTEGISGSAGAGVYINGAGAVNITGSQILKNAITGTAFASGAGIESGSGVLSITDSVIAGNSIAVTLGARGAGLSLNGTANLLRADVRENTVSGSDLVAGGGLVCNSSDALTVTDSSFLRNKVVVTDSPDLTADGGGGGAVYTGNCSATITRSVFAYNEAMVVDFGGGAALSFGTNDTSTVSLTNSTISNNKLTGGPGAAVLVIADTTLTLDQVTMADNTVDINHTEAGIQNDSLGTVTVARSVFKNTGLECSGISPYTTGGYNIVDDASCPDFNGTGDLASTDPKLAPLGTYGGLTMSQGLVAGSPALNNIPNASCSLVVDQRGVARPQPGGGNCDSGAIEGIVRTIDTVGIFRSSNATFYLRNSNTTGPADITRTFGASTSLPVAGDWNGDGVDTIGVFDPATGVFQLRNSNGAGAPTVYNFTFGTPGAYPVAGDWDGDGKDGVGYYDASAGRFYLKDSLTTGPFDYQIVLGASTDRPVAGDWDGDGRDSVGVYRTAQARFILSDTMCVNCTATVNYQFTLGVANDVGFAGDWNGDGKSGVGVFRPSNGITYMKNGLATGFADISIIYGIANDKPIAGRWLPSDGLPAPLFEPGR